MMASHEAEFHSVTGPGYLALINHQLMSGQAGDDWVTVQTIRPE